MSIVRNRFATYNWSLHAIDRFIERNDSGESRREASKKAGLAAEDNDTVASNLTYGADEIWLYAPIGRARNLLFVVQDSVVVTVLYAESYRLDVSGLHRCSHCGAIDEIVVANGCSCCSETVQKLQEGHC